jgi:O-antigen/teichoic acid export membrane protein
MFLWWFFPTAAGFKYAWIWALALSLIEILLIIPSSLWNSLLHKIPHYTDENKKKSLWNLMLLVGWIGALIAINFRVFAEDIIVFVSSRSFLWTWESINNWWSNQVLPFLWIVLILSFIKQVYNYLFVALEKQNILFGINLVWVLLWAVLGVVIIPKFWLLWWVITQVFIEMMFTFWAVKLAYARNLNPIFQKEPLMQLVVILLIFCIFWYGIHLYLLNARGEWLTIWSLELSAWVREMIRFFLIALVYNIAIAGISIPAIKKVAKGLTND